VGEAEWWYLPLVEGAYMSDLNRVKISAHLSLHELECKGRICCGYSVKIQPGVVLYFEATRKQIQQEGQPDRKLLVASGYRCPVYNWVLGSRTPSLDPLDPKARYHPKGMALDLTSPDVSKIRLAEAAIEAGWPRVGLYTKDGTLVLHCDLADAEAEGLPAVWGDGWPDLQQAMEMYKAVGGRG
jgi:hypothetical protein